VSRILQCIILHFFFFARAFLNSTSFPCCVSQRVNSMEAASAAAIKKASIEATAAAEVELNGLRARVKALTATNNQLSSDIAAAQACQTSTPLKSRPSTSANAALVGTSISTLIEMPFDFTGRVHRRFRYFLANHYHVISSCADHSLECIQPTLFYLLPRISIAVTFCRMMSQESLTSSRART